MSSEADLICDHFVQQRRIQALLTKQKEVNDLLSMAEDDITQVNHLVSPMHEYKEVRTTKTHLKTRL